MFGLLTRTPRRAAPSVRPARSVRLGLEALESRYCPASLSLAVAYGTQNNVTLSGDLTGTSTPGGQTIQLGGNVNGMATTDANGHYSITLQASHVGSVGAAWMVNGASQATASTTLSVTPPDIDQFSGVMKPGDLWTFSGHVTDPSPSGLVVQFGGVASMNNGAQATVNADGSFSFTIQLNGTPSDNGWVWAQTKDWYQQQSNIASTDVVQC